MSSRKAKPGRASRSKAKRDAASKAKPSPPPPRSHAAQPDEELDERGLSERERVFIEAFFASRFNASAAARGAYACEAPGSAASIGYEVKHRPHVAAEIDRRLKAAQLGAAEAVALLSDHARGDLGRYVTLDANGRPVFDLEALRADGAGHLIKKIKLGADGSLTVELHDSQAALDKILRAHGAYQDRLDVSGGVRIDELAGLAQAVKARLAGGSPPQEGADG